MSSSGDSKRFSQRGLQALEIMSPPAGTISQDASIAEAMHQMQRGHLDCLPILAGKRLVGMVSRWDAARAIQHRLGSESLRLIMTMPLPAVRPNASWERMYRFMAQSRVNNLLVVSQEDLLGVVSQSELLRFGPSGVKPSVQNPLFNGELNFREIMRKRYSPRIFRALRRVGDFGFHRGEEVFLVGGSVRDLLLETADMDIDIAVVGDGIDFARAYVARYGGRMVPYRRFATALMVLPGKLKVDVVSARWEQYRYPGALPIVESGALVHDLYRRDFSINSMAIQLSGEYFGRLIDPFGGQRDLARKKIEVMHNLSFVEDPTRMIRAIRFEGRYGFRMSARTRHLLQAAAETHMLDRVSGQRLREELLTLLREPQPLPAIRRLHQMGLLKSLSQGLTLSPELIRLLGRVRGHLLRWQRCWPEDGVEGWMVYLLALFSPLSSAEMQQLSDRLSLHRQAIDALHVARRVEGQIIEALSVSRQPPNSVLYQLLHRIPPGVLIYFMATTARRRVAYRILHYRRRLHHTALDMGGEDLKKMGLTPGVIYQRILDKVLAAKLDGRLQGRRDQLKMARRLVQGER